MITIIAIIASIVAAVSWGLFAVLYSRYAWAATPEGWNLMLTAPAVGIGAIGFLIHSAPGSGLEDLAFFFKTLAFAIFAAIGFRAVRGLQEAQKAVEDVTGAEIADLNEALTTSPITGEINLSDLDPMKGHK